MSPEIYRIAERSTAAFAPSAPARPSRASSPAWSRNAASRWTSAIWTPPRWRRMLQEAKAAERKLCARRQRARLLGTPLADRAASVQPRPHRAVRRSHPRNLRPSRIACPPARCTTPPKSPRAGVPTVMMFVQSLHGISHNKIEDTKEEHLELCVTAFDKLAEKAMGWIQQK